MSDLSVINYINPRVSTGKTEEVKATNNFLQGIPDSLERFFQKLEHLLRHGCLPPGEDPSVEPLPKELQELKGLLEGYRVGDYVLQRNETKRYRFSQVPGLLGPTLIVTREECSGFAVTKGWSVVTTENVNPGLILDMLRPENMSPSAIFASVLTVQQVCQKALNDLNAMALAATAEQPELKGTKKQTGIQSDITNISKKIRNVDECLVLLTQVLRDFNKAGFEEKYYIACELYRGVQDSYNGCNRIYDLINAKDFYDFLIELFACDYIPQLEKNHISCLKYKFGKQLGGIRNLRYEAPLVIFYGDKTCMFYILNELQPELHVKIDGREVEQNKIKILKELSDRILGDKSGFIKNDRDVEIVKSSISEEIDELDGIIDDGFVLDFRVGTQIYYESRVFLMQEYFREICLNLDEIQQKSGRSREINSIKSEITRINSVLNNLDEQIELICS
ncbi:hypothetical protein F9222_24770 [Escherichia coli]|nr:hypothetical protein F9222_24770 [Escherichia coli]